MAGKKKPNAFFKVVKVNHPGNKPQPFLGPGRDVAVKTLEVLLKKDLAKIPLKELLDHLSVLKRFDRLVFTAAHAGKNSAVRNAPVKTGRLKGSINVQQRRIFFYTIGTNVEYAAAQEFGAKPHTFEVRPKSKKSLAFFWDKLASAKGKKKK